jgi:uncharacterized protein (DUF1501 family)
MSSSLFQVSSRFNSRYGRAAAPPPAVIGVPQSALSRPVPRMAFATSDAGPVRDILVCVFQRGGMDGLSAVVPYGDGAKYYDVRKTIAVPEPGKTNGGLDLDGYFALHPGLAPLKELYDADQLAVVVATGGTDPTRSHFDAMRFMEQATPGNKTVGTGWIARHLESLGGQGASAFRAVGFGSLVQASLRGTGLVTPLALESIGDFHLEGRWDALVALQAQLESFYHTAAPQGLLDNQAKALFETITQLQTLGSANYVPEHGAVYPTDDYFAFQLQQCAQIIKADMGLEVACVDVGGWDTHETEGVIGGYFASLMASIGQSIGAFYKDLGPAFQARVTVVTMSEFGRRVEENASAGTDHGHGNCMFILGGGVNGGRVYGTWPTLTPSDPDDPTNPTTLDDGDLRITTDQRHVLSELVSRRLLNTNLSSVFPDPNYVPQSLGIFKTI